MMKKKNNCERTVLITGAAGFIGYHLSKRMLENNYNVIGIDNLNSYYSVELKRLRLKELTEYSNFIFEKKDISVKNEVDEVFYKYQPEIVINLAAQAGVRYSIENPQSYISSNLVGFFNILEACRNLEGGLKHLIFASSSSVYGNQKKVPFSTSDKVDAPVSLYAATKKSNELLAYSYSHLYGIPTTGLRFFTVYGPYGRPDMAYFSFTENILNGKPIRVFNNGDMYRDFTYIDDIVNAIVNLLDLIPQEDENRTKYKVYNLGNSKPEKLIYFIETLEKALGKDAIKEYLPIQPGDVYQTYADISESERDFGYCPQTSIEDGLYKFVNWYKIWKGYCEN